MAYLFVCGFCRYFPKQNNSVTTTFVKTTMEAAPTLVIRASTVLASASVTLRTGWLTTGRCV